MTLAPLSARVTPRVVNSATKEPFTYQDPCVERGPNIGYNAAAHAAATQAVKDFLRVTLKVN